MAIFDWIDEEEYEFWQKQRKADRRAQDAEASRRYAQPGPFDDGFQQAQRMEPLRTLQPVPPVPVQPQPIQPPDWSQLQQPYGQPGPFDVAAMPQGRVRRTDEPEERETIAPPDVLGDAWKAARQLGGRDLLPAAGPLGNVARAVTDPKMQEYAEQVVAPQGEIQYGSLLRGETPMRGVQSVLESTARGGARLGQDIARQGLGEAWTGAGKRWNEAPEAFPGQKGLLEQTVPSELLANLVGPTEGVKGIELAERGIGVLKGIAPDIGQGLKRAGQAFIKGAKDVPVGLTVQDVAAPKRYYHGTGSAFDVPDAAKFDPNGLYGPGYYLTDSADVAGSYAGARGDWGDLEGNYSKLTREMGQLQKQLASLPGDASPISRGDLEAEIKYLRPQLEAAQEQLRRAAGPNIRAIDVPQDLRLLDTDKPIPPDLLPVVEAHVARYAPQDLPAVSLKDTGDTAWSRLAFNGRSDSPQMANNILARAGFDGIKYPGGKRIPMMDAAGNPIEHEAVVIFPESLPKIRNAISGTPMGMAPEATGAVLGSAYGLATDDPTLSDRERVSEFLQKTAGGGLGARILTKGMKGIKPGLTVEKVGKGLDQAFTDWNSGRAYIDNAGNYRVRPEGKRQGSGPIAPWNKEAKAAFKDVSEFHNAAQAAKTVPVPTEASPVAQAATPEPLATKQPWEMTFGDIDARYPQVKDTVDGRQVGQAVPNMTSIDSSLDNPTTLEGVRDVPISIFEDSGPPKFQSATEKARTERLAEQIRQSGRVDPLIVVDDAQSSPYILEGAHRFDALKLLGAKSFPAKVVIDEDAYYNAAKQALSEGKPVPDEVLADYPDLAKAAPAPEIKPPLTEPEPIKATGATLTQEAATPPIASVDEAAPAPEAVQPAEVRPRRPTMAERYEQWKATQPPEPEPVPAAAAGAPPPEPPQGPPPTLPSGRQPGGPQNIRPYTPPDPYQQLQDALKPETQSLGQQLGEGFNGFMRAMYDRNYDLGALEKATGIPVHKLAQVVSGAVAAGEDRVRRFVLPIVEPLGKDVKHLEEYMVLMRNGDILARNPSAQLPGGIPGWPGVLEAEKRLQARIGPERFAKVKAAAEQMWKVNDDWILKPLVDEEMLSRDSYRAIKSAHPHYIDFHRADFSLTDTVERGLVRPEANVSNLGIKQMELAGSQRKLDQPLARTEAQIIRTRVLISRNKAARGIVEALQALEKEVPEVQRRVRLLSSKEAAEHSNVTDTISFFKDGQKVVYQVPPQFASIAKHVEAETVGGWWNLASQVLGASVLRKGAVQYNPLFLVVNPMRDAVGAFFREGLVPMSPEYMRGWVAAITQNSLFTDAAEAGALMSGIVDTMRSTEALSRASGLGKIQVNSWEDALKLVPRLIQQRAWGDLLKLPPRLIERANIAGEQATRIATYAKLRGQGIGELEAAVRARDVSVDFAKSGNVMKLINQMIPFSNAGLQGASNTVRLFKDNPKQALLASSLLAMPSIAAYTWNQRYESSKKIPEYEYINFWVLQVGEGTKNVDPKYPDQPAEKFPVYIRIPKGPTGAFVTAPVEMALRLAEAKGDASVQDQLLKGAWTMARSLSPIEPNLSGIVPPVGGTAIGISTGQDLFRGQDIVPRREESRPEELQYGSETSDVAVALGERFQMSPRMIEWAIKDVGAGVASQTLWVSDMVLNSLGYNPEAPGEIKRQALTETEAISRNPIVGRFVGTRGTAEESANWDRFNKLVEDTNRAYASIPEVRRFGLTMGPVSESVSIDGKAQPYTWAERMRLQQDTFDARKTGIEALTGSSLYTGADDAEKLALIQDVARKANEWAKAGRLAAEMREYPTALEQRRQYKEIEPRITGRTPEQIRQAADFAKMKNDIAQTLPPMKDRNDYALRMAAEKDPKGYEQYALRMYIEKKIGKQLTMLKQDFWAKHPLLQKFFSDAPAQVPAKAAS